MACAFPEGTSGLTSFASRNNVAIPSSPVPNNLIAPLWDDLTTSSGLVYFETRGTAPDREFIVQWDNVKRAPAGSLSPVTFEIILHETSSDMEFQYLDVTFGSFADNGSSATIGIENSDASDGIQYSVNQAVLSDNFAILIEHPPKSFEVFLTEGIGLSSGM